MTKVEYLNQHCVSAFVVWLSKIIQGDVPLEFHYGENPGNVWHTLYCALEGYRWPRGINRGHLPRHCTPNWEFPEGARFCLPAKSTLAVNEAVLGRLKAGLDTAMRTNGDNPAPWVAAILLWGGVYNGGNRDWLERNCNEIRAIVNGTMEALSADNDDLSKFRNLRFNSGMTKVYSLLLTRPLLKDFIIYDSRVAAALAWLVWKWCKSRDPAVPPPSLAFACMKAKEGKNAKRPKIRNPDKCAFPYLNADPYNHAKWNLRANWILDAAFTLPNSGKTSIASGNFNSLREVEAALFTMGYDLRHAI